jgi:glycosyltransferase involved in cell wall biosynthesis
MPPFFSIIMPTYNRAQLITKSIESVLEQSFPDWELIIVDDGSTDETKKLIESYTDIRIKYIYQQNAERSAARNNGIKHAKGKYICFLDSDDYYQKERLSKLHFSILLNGEKVALYYTGIAYDKKNEIIDRPELPNTFKNINDFIVLAVIGTPQVCIHNLILQRHIFNPKFAIGEDMELWLRIIPEFPLVYLKNQHTVVALEHEDRSVNVKRYNSYQDTLLLFKYVFSANHSGNKISSEIKAKVFGNCYYGIAKHYIYNQKRILASFYLAKSISIPTLFISITWHF